MITFATSDITARRNGWGRPGLAGFGQDAPPWQDLPAEWETQWTRPVGEEPSIGERIGDVFADIVERIGTQLPGILNPLPSPPVRQPAPFGTTLNIGTLLLIGGAVYFLTRRR